MDKMKDETNSQSHHNTSVASREPSHQPSSRDQHGSGEKQTAKPWHRSLVYMGIVVFSTLAIGAAIAAGVVVSLNNNENNQDDVEPRYMPSPNEINIHGNCFNKSNAACNFVDAVGIVRMSADGNRLFVVSEEIVMGVVQVYDLNNENQKWDRQATINPPNYTEFLDFAAARTGQSFVLSYKVPDGPHHKPVVRIYEQHNASLSGWDVSAEITGEDFLEISNRRATDNGWPGSIVLTPYSWGESLDMSSNGDTVVVGAPAATFYSNTSDGELELVGHETGAFQVFRRNRDVDESSPDAIIWNPIGKTAQGRREQQACGRRVKYIPGTDLVITATETPDLQVGLGAVNITTGRFVYGDAPSITDARTTDDRRHADLMAVSPDGKFLVVSNANYESSAYAEKPYQGMLQVFKYNNTEQEFESVTTIRGQRPFLHLGTSLAIAEDYTIVAGTASTDSSVTETDYLKVFRYTSQRNGEEGDFWIEDEDNDDRVGSAGLGSAEDGWWSVDISSDGRRIVAAQPTERVKIDLGDGFGERTMDGTISLFHGREEK